MDLGRQIAPNDLLSFAQRPSRARRAVECAVWILAYGVAIGALWYGAVSARVEGWL